MTAIDRVLTELRAEEAWWSLRGERKRAVAERSVYPPDRLYEAEYAEGVSNGLRLACFCIENR